MKQRNRKRFDPAFKARVALEVMQERESMPRNTQVTRRWRLFCRNHPLHG